MPANRIELTPVPWRAAVLDQSRRVQISLILAVENARAAADWFKQALGAAELWSLGSGTGLETDGAPFFFHEPTPQRGFQSPNVVGTTTARVEVSSTTPTPASPRP